MKSLINSLALAAAIPMSLVGHVAAQETPAGVPPAPVEQAPAPEAGLPVEEEPGVLYDGGGYPGMHGAEVTPAYPLPGCDPLAAPPIVGIHPQPLYCPQVVQSGSNRLPNDSAVSHRRSLLPASAPDDFRLLSPADCSGHSLVPADSGRPARGHDADSAAAGLHRIRGWLSVLNSPHLLEFLCHTVCDASDAKRRAVACESEKYVPPISDYSGCQGKLLLPSLQLPSGAG